MMHATACDKKCTTAARVTHTECREIVRILFIIDSSEPTQNLFSDDKNIEDTIIFDELMIMRKMLGELNSRTESQK